MRSTAATATTTSITTEQIFKQSFKILNSNPFHFITLSLLFIPFTIAISAVYQNLLSLKTLTTLLAVTVTVILPAVAATALIAYSTHNSIHRKPITFIPAFKSLSHSFIPLISTLISLIIVTLFFQLITLVRFRLLFVIIWGYAAAVSVLESKSGFVPLVESFKQFGTVSFSIACFTGFGIITTVFTYPAVYGKGTTAMCISILFYACSYMLASSTILFYVVANTVWYVRCKVARGEEIVYTPVEWKVSAKEGFNLMMSLVFGVRIIAWFILDDQGLI